MVIIVLVMETSIDIRHCSFIVVALYFDFMEVDGAAEVVPEHEPVEGDVDGSSGRKSARPRAVSRLLTPVERFQAGVASHVDLVDLGVLASTLTTEQIEQLLLDKSMSVRQALVRLVYVGFASGSLASDIIASENQPDNVAEVAIEIIASRSGDDLLIAVRQFMRLLCESESHRFLIGRIPALLRALAPRMNNSHIQGVVCLIADSSVVPDRFQEIARRMVRQAGATIS